MHVEIDGKSVKFPLVHGRMRPSEGRSHAAFRHPRAVHSHCWSAHDTGPTPNHSLRVANIGVWRLYETRSAVN
jgi:hypothetical protein